MGLDRDRSRHHDTGGPWRAWYKTARWQKLRWRVLVRDLFTCQMTGCGRIEHDSSQLVADHIKAHRGDVDLFWDETNLQCLCKRCHDKGKQQAEQSTLQTRGVWY
ncbi:HNH endonuclease [Mesorhizobium sp. NBSH29]|uniref:HNH endonuclease n=1 Tax=Mesorhizobium sp. NBSH29 TaxID=2654249 RepID=UPI001AED375F|nr:HNH endonuclease signature motif containing protein [Mesorhizobium sp. NBSH29]